MFVIGIGLGSGVASNKAWDDAYSTSQGALIVEGFRPLGAFGSFCSVLTALGLISNIVAPTYASGVDWQALGKFSPTKGGVLLGGFPSAACMLLRYIYRHTAI